eukprot:5167491-Pyramimonas_sp.AAC.1
MASRARMSKSFERPCARAVARFLCSWGREVTSTRICGSRPDQQGHDLHRHSPPFDPCCYNAVVDSKQEQGG